MDGGTKRDIDQHIVLPIDRTWDGTSTGT